ncbi:MAG TPA: winged helix-turn-helix transcriptional regulator [Bacilli bacterium]|nr:winged helix-turn-helix transcriptional regulator [Bacilli bacterium]
MNENQFFKPTVLYKEYMILDMIEKNANTTQREISKAIGIAVSMVNDYLDTYEKNGLIKRNYLSTKNVEYIITKKGIERKKVLNIRYLKSTHSIYQSAKDNIFNFLNQIIKLGFKKILLYGAGEVAEIILQVLDDNTNIPLDVIAVIDDDKTKKQTTFVNLPVIDINEINKYHHDGILISSYTHNETIYKKLISINYPKERIIQFFS